MISQSENFNFTACIEKEKASVFSIYTKRINAIRLRLKKFGA